MNHALRKTLGAHIAALLETRAMSQSALATAIGKSQSTVSQIIHGRTAVTIDTIGAIADALRVSHTSLLTRSQRPRKHMAHDLDWLCCWHAAPPNVRRLVVEMLHLATADSQTTDTRRQAVKLVASLVEVFSEPIHPRPPVPPARIRNRHAHPIA